MDTAIQKAQDKIGFVRSSEEEIWAYHMREMAMMDYTSGMNFARQEGMAKGIAKVTRNMKQAGIPTNQIALFTGLSETEIDQL
jgi:predicted transposase/invertase (TIGR01784 family)